LTEAPRYGLRLRKNLPATFGEGCFQKFGANGLTHGRAFVCYLMELARGHKRIAITADWRGPCPSKKTGKSDSRRANRLARPLASHGEVRAQHARNENMRLICASIDWTTGHPSTRFEQ
jgi:hypothetical protein